MQKNNAVLDEVAPAPAIKPDMLAKLKKDDMRQAVSERFKVEIDQPVPSVGGRTKKRSPYWQPADQEC